MYLRPNKSSVKYYLQDKWTKFTSFPLGACVCLFVYEFDIHMHMITIRKHKGKDHIFKSNRTNKINPIGIYIPKPYGKCWLILFNYFIIHIYIIYLTGFLLIAILVFSPCIFVFAINESRIFWKLTRMIYIPCF